MSLGSLFLKCRQKFGHGLRVAYWRDIIRPRILKTRPISDTTDGRCEIHVLTSFRDWLDLVWALKSFYYFSDRHYALCIHDDGTLDDRARDALEEHFPTARVIARSTADLIMSLKLQDYPLSNEFRTKNPLALKVFDFAVYLESDRMLLMDSDILFFAKPVELLSRLEDKGYNKTTLNKDWGMGYTVAPDVVQTSLDFTFLSFVNSGLGLLQKQALTFSHYERYLAMPGVLGHPHRIEQTLIAMACCRHGFEFLPACYDVTIADGKPVEPCKHYTGPIRHLMYKEGIRHLVRRGFLTEIGQGNGPSTGTSNSIGVASSKPRN